MSCPSFYAAGLVYTGLVPSRPRDKAALGVVSGFFQDDLREAQREAGLPTQGVETIIELNYQIELTRFAYLRPDMQYIFNPNGDNEIDDAFVVGFELGVRF